MTGNVYRNRHYHTPGHAHELTFSCYRRIPFFSKSLAWELFLEELQTWARRNGCGVVPDTFTLPVELPDPQKIKMKMR